jgi:hypothetical protein
MPFTKVINCGVTLVGSMGKLYLFDLGDLEEHALVKKNDLIDSHCQRLAARIQE